MAQPALAERARQRDRRGPRAAVADPDDHDAVPHVDVTTLAIVGAVVLAAILVAIGLASLRSRAPGAAGVTFVPSELDVPKEHWTMPPATLLSRPRFSASRRAGMLVLGGYMVVALVMLIVKSVQLAGGRAWVPAPGPAVAPAARRWPRPARRWPRRPGGDPGARPGPGSPKNVTRSPGPTNG